MLKKTLVLVLFVAFGLALYPYPSEAMNVTLAWDANTETDLAGYKMYYGNTPGGPYSGTGATEGGSPIVILLTRPQFVPTSPEFTVHNLDGLKQYAFVLTATDAEGLESGYSNQVLAGPNLYILTTSVVGTGGTVSPGGSFIIGTIQTVTATPVSGYRVKAWTGTNNDTSKANTNTVTMTAAKTVTVSFELIPTPPAAPKNLRAVTITASSGTIEFALAADPQPDVEGFSVLYAGEASWVDVPYQETTVNGQKTAIVYVNHYEMIPVNSTRGVYVKAWNEAGESQAKYRTFYFTETSLNQSDNARMTRYQRWW